MSKSERVRPGDIDVDVELTCAYIYIRQSTWAGAAYHMAKVEQIAVSSNVTKLMLSFYDLGPLVRLMCDAT